MPKYPFLSDEWIAEARRLRTESGREDEPVTAPVRVNQVVTDVPFGEGRIAAHVDTTSGTLQLDTGHLDGADATITLDYDTAKALFVDGTPEAGLQAFMAGKITVQGDLAKLLAAVQHAAPEADSAAAEFQEKIRAITA